MEIHKNAKVVGYISEIDLDLISKGFGISDGYITMVRNKNRYLHTLIMQRIIGRKLKKNEMVDHINQIRNDNQRCNLRIASKSQNMSNRGPTKANTSGYKGVSWIASRRKWQATIQVNYKTSYLGRYNTPEDAARAYNEAALKFFGEFASLNKL